MFLGGPKSCFLIFFSILDPGFGYGTHYDSFVLSNTQIVSSFLLWIWWPQTLKKSGHLFGWKPNVFSHRAHGFCIYLHLPGLFWWHSCWKYTNSCEFRHDILHFSCWRIMLWFYQWFVFFQPTLSRLGETATMKIQFTEIPPPTRLCSFTSSTLQTIVLITIPFLIDSNMTTISIIWGASEDCLANMFESHFYQHKNKFYHFPSKTRWWQLKYALYSSRTLGKWSNFDEHIF